MVEDHGESIMLDRDRHEGLKPNRAVGDACATTQQFPTAVAQCAPATFAARDFLHTLG